MSYEYSEFNEYNRFQNLDGIEAKIIDHLVGSESKHAKLFWKLLKYNTKDALSCTELTKDEKLELIEGTTKNLQLKGKIKDGEEPPTRLFMTPFSDDAWSWQNSSVYIYVDNVYPIDQGRAEVSITVETVTHSKINTLYTDADMISNAEYTNPNDYYYSSDTEPSVQYKSRATVLLKCILAELNGLYIDGIGYLQFNTDKAIDGDKIQSKVELNLYSRRSFFGHSVRFNICISGVSGYGGMGY